MKIDPNKCLKGIIRVAIKPNSDMLSLRNGTHSFLTLQAIKKNCRNSTYLHELHNVVHGFSSQTYILQH